jgi:ABC-2 type transport system ATP-binding protein
VIEVRDLYKRFGKRAVLQGLSLSVRPGERVALVGPNGSGKTTLLRCLLGMVAYEGTVRIAGADPLREHVAAQEHVVYVPQRAPALPVPVGEVVSFWAATRRKPADALVQAAGALGLDVAQVRSRRFVELSGGMQQKLLAAMALASSCDVLLLDEPTANLDPPARAAFFEALARRSPAPTILLSSHRLEELTSLVDRVIVLREGQVAFDGQLERMLETYSEARVLAFRRSM